jgi:hypothetical protein
VRGIWPGSREELATAKLTQALVERVSGSICFNNPIVFIFLVVSCHVPRRKPLAPLNLPKSQLKPLLPYNLYKLLKRVLGLQYPPNLQKPLQK